MHENKINQANELLRNAVRKDAYECVVQDQRKLLIVLLTVVPIMIVIIKTVFRRKLPSNYYTPFDYISAQTTEEFHEEKEEIKREDENGDSKN
ncbi:DUF3951 domain-containing protein [Priestia megaterium]|nr:DUF3951 domain-containing protein [Priestia megaterium]